MIKRFLLSLLAVGMLTSVAKGELILTIADDGFNLIMTMTGSYDLSAATQNGSFGLGSSAWVAPSFGVFGWEAIPGPGYEATFTGSITSTGYATVPTNVSTTTPIFFYGDVSRIVLQGGSPLIGSVNNTAVFEGVTLSSLGMVAGESMTVSWQGDSATIQVVPEPSTWTLMAVGAVAAFWRLRRRTTT